ncbi:MAG: tetratricopeptide repeat protein, partial [Myxococcales bacterium]|nr:tetratricopeptide repeat protein [Myxococcales bacterium]
TFLVGYLLARTEEGLVWAEAAEHALQLVEPNGGDLSTDLVAHRARILQKLEHFEQAEPLLERALAERRARLGEDHPGVAADLTNLAGLRYAQGDTVKAEALMQEVLAIRERVYGPEHPLVAEALANLAVVRRRAGDYQAALDLNERAIAVQEIALDPNHPQLANTHNNIGNAYSSLGRYAEAKRHLERAAAILESNPEHPDYVKALTNLARVELNLGEVESARALSEDVLARQRRRLGSSHGEVAEALSALANVDLAEEDRVQARAHLEQALAMFEAVAPDHPGRSRAECALARMDAAAGDLDAAAQGYERARQRMTERLGADHPDLAEPLLGLAEVARDRGELGAALELATRAEALQVDVGVAPQELSRVRLLRAELLAALPTDLGGDPKRARFLAEQARSSLETLDDPESRKLRAALDAWLLRTNP